MDFIPITVLREVSGYRDRRSITRWAECTLGIQLHKVGRNWCVVREEYEKAIRLRFQSPARPIAAQRKYVPANAHEQKFLADVYRLLTQRTEL